MSRYKRDDAKFRAQIQALAASGLKLDRTPVNLAGVPAYIRVTEPAKLVSVPYPLDMAKVYGESAANLRKQFSQKVRKTRWSDVLVNLLTWTLAAMGGLWFLWALAVGIFWVVGR